MKPNRLSRDFYQRDTLVVARELLGNNLVCLHGNTRVSGIIIETEAYKGEEDLGCHCRSGITNRNKVMFGSPGHAYVYFTYGMHWMFNIVTETEGIPGAVLVRAIIPTDGEILIAERRKPIASKHWTDGPAKLCQALAIDGTFNGHDLCRHKSKVFVEEGILIPENSVTNTPRVGLYTVPEPWKSIPWRFLVDKRKIRLDDLKG